jgi:hypothetical protein
VRRSDRVGRVIAGHSCLGLGLGSLRFRPNLTLCSRLSAPSAFSGTSQHQMLFGTRAAAT